MACHRHCPNASAPCPVERAGIPTPVPHRGHGYASGVVAHASKLALASGARGCTLFTDLMNPVSNRIYERIGYRRVGEFTSLEW